MVIPATDAVVEMTVEGGYDPVAVPCTNFIKGFLPILRLHVPTAVGVAVGMNRYVQAEYDVLVPRLGLLALGFDPVEAFLRYEPVVRVGTRVVEQHEADAITLKKAVGRFSEMFFEELFRIMVSGDLVNRFADVISDASVDGVLLDATIVHYVAEMKNEISRSIF